MKKFISLCLLLVFMLCGCNQQSLNKNLNSISKKQQTDATNFSTANENSSLESQQTTDAQKIYEKFLNNEIPATTKTGSLYISEHTRLSDGKSGIDRYAFYNNEKYDVPLLHIQALEHSVFYFDGENVVLLYSSPITRTEGNINILNDGTVYSTHESLGLTSYHFASFSGEKNVEIAEFSVPDPMDKDGVFYLNGKKLSYEEYETKIKPYSKLAKSSTDVEWLTWE